MTWPLLSSKSSELGQPFIYGLQDVLQELQEGPALLVVLQAHATPKDAFSISIQLSIAASAPKR
jgi:hypothetical protein